MPAKCEMRSGVSITGARLPAKAKAKAKTPKAKAPAAVTMRMRRFQLHRDEDATGTSGAGIIAEGCEFSNGTCALTWLSPFITTSTWSSIKAVDIIHGHSGKTRVVWIDL
jgi:hypothetical protein